MCESIPSVKKKQDERATKTMDFHLLCGKTDDRFMCREIYTAPNVLTRVCEYIYGVTEQLSGVLS